VRRLAEKQTSGDESAGGNPRAAASSEKKFSPKFSKAISRIQDQFGKGGEPLIEVFGIQQNTIDDQQKTIERMEHEIRKLRKLLSPSSGSAKPKELPPVVMSQQSIERLLTVAIDEVKKRLPPVIMDDQTINKIAGMMEGIFAKRYETTHDEAAGLHEKAIKALGSVDEMFAALQMAFGRDLRGTSFLRKLCIDSLMPMLLKALENQVSYIEDVSNLVLLTNNDLVYSALKDLVEDENIAVESLAGARGMSIEDLDRPENSDVSMEIDEMAQAIQTRAKACLAPFLVLDALETEPYSQTLVAELVKEVGNTNLFSALIGFTDNSSLLEERLAHAKGIKPADLTKSKYTQVLAEIKGRMKKIQARAENCIKFSDSGAGAVISSKEES